MGSTPEGKVKDDFIEFLDEIGAYYVMPIGTEFGKNGVSDFIVAVPNRHVPALFFAIEAKATKKQKPTELQKRELNKAIDAGAIGLVLHKDNAEKIKELLRYATTATYGELQKLAVWAADRRYTMREATRTKAVPVSREDFIRGTRHA